MIRLASVFFAGFGIVTACGSSESEAPSGSGGVAGGGAVGGGAGVANSDGASGASAARVGDPCTSYPFDQPRRRRDGQGLLGSRGLQQRDLSVGVGREKRCNVLAGGGLRPV